MNDEISTMNVKRKTEGEWLRILHILHTLKRAGAEQLVYELTLANREQMQTAVVCLDEEGVLAEELRRAGVKVYFTQRKAGIDLSQVSKIRAAIKDFRPAVIHCHQYTPFFYGATAAWKAGIGKVLFTEHGRHWPDIVGWKRRFFNRCWLNRRADRMTAVCQFSRNRLAEKDGFPREKIEVIYNGVQVSQFENINGRDAIRAELGIAGTVKVIVQVGTFRKVKDQATAIKAFQIVKKKCDNAVLLFVGDGPELADCQKLAEKLELTDSILFAGQRSDIPWILSAGDMMLMTSLSEAHSVSLLEGMAAGLPIVATNVGGNGETIIDGETGRLIPAGNAEKIAEAILEILADDEMRIRMGQAGHERVKKYFTREAMHRRYLEIYNDLVNGTTRNGRG